ncbi:ABC transporter substrate-binding protein [Ramlibacter sp.]|uniref:ABC transporter substrate-binding protein n=1 Tax=Ramlibacter sp. TaxID=1917967 RepID=UPI003D13460A
MTLVQRRNVLSAFAASMLAFAAGASSAQELVIGAPLAMTGPAGQVSADVVKGAQLAIDEVNAAGGVLGRKLKLEVQDTTGAPAQAVQLVGSFARNPNVIAILGPINAAEVGAVTGLAASNKIVVYAPASAGTVPGVPDLKFNEWTFRLNQAQPTVLGPLVNQVAAISKAKSITILNYSDNGAYVDAGNLWQKTAEGKGMTVQRIQFPSATQDFSAIVTQIKKDTQLVGIGALSGTLGPLIRAIRQAGINAPIMGDASILAASVFTVSQGASKGAYSYSSYLSGAGTGTNEFIAGFKKAHNADPSAIASYGYEAVKLIANALKTQKAVTRQALRDGLGKTRGYKGITGDVSYNNSGDAVRQSVPLVQVGDNGELKKVGDIKLQ